MKMYLFFPMRQNIRRVFDLVTAESGYTYTLTAPLNSVSSPLKFTSEKLKLYGTTTLKTPEVSEVVYNLSTNTLNVTLAAAEKYDPYYMIRAGSESLLCPVTAVKPAVAGSTTIKSITFSKDNTSAVISVYNTLYEEVTADIIGFDSEGNKIIRETISIPPESVGTLTVKGENLNSLEWAVG